MIRYPVSSQLNLTCLEANVNYTIELGFAEDIYCAAGGRSAGHLEELWILEDATRRVHREINLPPERLEKCIASAHCSGGTPRETLYMRQ
jgi:hypothetical protein